MKVTWSELGVPGLMLSGGASVTDARGGFTKVLSGDDPALKGFVGRELYWTSSQQGVLRGLHFQMPPHSTSKLVYVVHGAIRDFVVDLRRGSPMERQLFEIQLDPSVGGLLVPPGCAHAYEVLENHTIVCYAQDIPYSGDNTYGGIHPLSAGIIPRSPHPIMLARDEQFPSLSDFVSPFVYGESQ